MRVKSALREKKNSYEIYYEENFNQFYNILVRQKANYKKVLIVSDTKVAASYLNELKSIVLKIEGVSVVSFVIDHGAKQKNEKNYLDLIKKLKEEDFATSDLIISLGGCAVNALCNFASGTYMGGIDYIHIPTTLSAMINGTVANVCAINLLTYQNALCSYATPLFVYVNVGVLDTLKSTEYQKGIVNAIKLALTQDGVYFDFIDVNKQRLLDKDKQALISLIKKANELRNDIKKKPNTLTLIESEGFGMAFYLAVKENMGMLRSEAQIMVDGMVKAIELSQDLIPSDQEKIKNLFEFFGLKTKIRVRERDQAKIINTILKYRGRGNENDIAHVNMILLSDIGACYKKVFKTVSLMPAAEKKPKLYKGNSVLKYTVFAVASLFLIFLDQYTKYIMTHKVQKDTILSFCGDIIEMFYYQNKGAAFGILQGQQVLFFFLTLIVIALIFIFMYRMPFLRKYKQLFIFTVLLFAGSMGNFIDRVRFGYVVDFIYFKPINFPVFNLADCFITIACILLLYSIVFIYQEKDFEFITRQ